MQIGIIGINHKSADVSLREQFAKICQRRFGPNCSAHPHVAYVLLSTCNRIELYFSSFDLAATHTYILGILRDNIQEEFEHKVYSYFGKDCFFHLACVTSGMDSAIIGETEIQGQVKKAYEAAAEYHYLPRELHFLFQKCLKIGKEVRSSHSFFCQMPSLEESVVTAASRRLGGLRGKTVLFIGMSEINRKILYRLKHCGLKNVAICNRSRMQTELFAKQEGIGWVAWENLSSWICYDLTIFGTKSPDYLVSAQSFACPLENEKLLIDLCVPRNVDPRLGDHSNISLLNIDQLHRLADRNQKLKAAEAARFEVQDIFQAVSKQIDLFKAKTAYRLEVAAAS